MSYSPKSVAHYFIKRAWDEGRPITPLALQKLVYISHGFYLWKTGDALVNGGFEAWPYGPVNVELYEEFKKFGSGAINQLAPARLSIKDIPVSDRAAWGILDFVWSRYGGKTAIQLSQMTHEEGSPWQRVRCRGKIVPISDSLIRDFYTSTVVPRVKGQQPGVAH